MRNEAPVIVLAEWAARLNAETRTCMGHSVAPEIPERQEARAYLAGLMSDQEAAACVAADLERVRDLGPKFGGKEADLLNSQDISAVPGSGDGDYAGLSSTFAAACRAADQKQRRQPPDPTIERARRLLADDVTLERAWHELNKPAGVAASTLQAAEHLLQQKDPQRLRAWLAKRSAEEFEAIHQYFRNKKEAGQ